MSTTGGWPARGFLKKSQILRVILTYNPPEGTIAIEQFVMSGKGVQENHSAK